MKLKVCGLKYPGNLNEVLALNPDYVGLIFYPPSPRYMEESLPPEAVANFNGVKKVGVFVNSGWAEMLERAHTYGLDLIQLHGRETPEIAGRLKDAGLEVVKAFSVGEKFDFRQLDPFMGVVDYFLFDTQGRHPGGNGKTFDWHLLRGYEGDVPFFLSGGIGPEHSASIRHFHHPRLHALDLNSRFERQPGLKDPVLLKQFINVYKSSET